MTPVAKQSGYFKSFDGTRIYYEVRGQGKPLVFVYGIACLINHWHPQLTRLSTAGYQTIVCDFRGHHLSDTPEDKKNLSIEALAKDVIALCEHLKIENAVFLGHSFGGEVMLETYLQKPSLFTGMVFISCFFSNPFSNLMRDEVRREIFIGLKKAYNASPELFHSVWKFGVTNPLSMFLSSLVGGFNFEKTAIKDIEIYSQGVANIDLRVFFTLFEELTQHDSMHLLNKLALPSLVLAGEKDALTPPQVQEQIDRELPDSRLHIIPEGSHCVQLDFPEEVNARIEEFLNSLKY